MSAPAPFDFEIDMRGAHIVVTRTPIYPACLTDGEVDYHISYLKSELDRLSGEMKRAIREQRKKPLYGDR